MSIQHDRGVICGARTDGLTNDELSLLWRAALRLHACDTTARAEVVVAEATAEIPASPALERALAETLASALDLIRERERLQDLARCDPLTGLSNRRSMEEELERRIPEHTRLARPMAVGILDLDRFRDCNERHGHLAGDLVRRSLAVLLQGFRRGSDLPCRYGGEEFVLIMPDTTAAEAATRLEPLRDRLATMGIHHEGRLLDPVTASIGVAEFPTDGDSFTALLAAADLALYRAKREGRNRICRAGHDAGSAAAGSATCESPLR